MQWAFTEGKRKTKSSIHIPDVPIKQSFSRKLSSCGKRTQEFRRRKQTKKLTCEIRAAAEEIVPSFGLINLSAALQGVGASAGITQCSSLEVSVSHWHQSTALIYTILPVQQLQSWWAVTSFFITSGTCYYWHIFWWQEWHKWDFSVFSYLCFKNLLRLLHRSWKLGGLRVQNKADTSPNSP